MHSVFTRFTAAAVFAVLGTSAVAQTTITSRPAGGTVSPFGRPDTATYGQTFVAPLVDNVLDSFDFDLYDGVDTFKFYVMEWDGSKATGPILYESSTLTGPGGLTTYTINTGGVSLVGGGSYVGFISTSALPGNTGASFSYLGSVDYTDGRFVFLNNGPDAGQWTTTSWNYFGSTDWAFTAKFSPGSPAVPEPGTVAMLAGMGGAALLVIRRRR